PDRARGLLPRLSSGAARAFLLGRFVKPGNGRGPAAICGGTPKRSAPRRVGAPSTCCLRGTCRCGQCALGGPALLGQRVEVDLPYAARRANGTLQRTRPC